MTDFDGLVVLVTGGASGIGAATAELLMQREPGSPSSTACWTVRRTARWRSGAT